MNKKTRLEETLLLAIVSIRMKPLRSAEHRMRAREYARKLGWRCLSGGLQRLS